MYGPASVRSVSTTAKRGSTGTVDPRSFGEVAATSGCAAAHRRHAVAAAPVALEAECHGGACRGGCRSNSRSWPSRTNRSVSAWCSSVRDAVPVRPGPGDGPTADGGVAGLDRDLTLEAAGPLVRDLVARRAPGRRRRCRRRRSSGRRHGSPDDAPFRGCVRSTPPSRCRDRRVQQLGRILSVQSG